MKKYFSGEKLYGDDFNSKQIAEWIKDEKEGYSNTDTKNIKKYGYHELNKLHGYSKLKEKSFSSALCFGGGKCEELLPIVDKVEKIYAVEPSQLYKSEKLKGKKIKYITPRLDGKIKAKDNTFDLITCFGVLHHIPNVTSTIKELKRILKKDGRILIREPTVSMGDWRKKRFGITKRERGIPLKVFDDIIKKEDLKIIYKARILHPISRRGFGISKYPFNSKVIVRIDALIGKIFSFNKRYHATKWFHKLQPQSVFYVLKK